MSRIAMDRTSPTDRPLSIVVLLGGWSAEREISLTSGRAVTEALRSRGHDVRELDPAQIDLLSYPWGGVDAAFIALHGSFGEDGTVQQFLAEMRVRYTGSGPQASRLAMSKSSSKLRFRSADLPTPEYRSVHESEPETARQEKAMEVGFPLVVKPDAQGSSIGVSLIQSPEELEIALEAAFRYDPVALLERYIAGRELTVAILEGRPLPVIEIRSTRSFFDYQAKYSDEGTEYILDSDLSSETIRQVESTAARAVSLLGCEGIARVDLRLDTAGRPWLLEVNTIPGFTAHSLVPKAAARAGIDFAALCESLVRTKLLMPESSPENLAA